MSLTHHLPRRLLLLLAPFLLVIGLSSSPAHAAVPSTTYVDTGWQYYDGGCQARTQAYFYTASNTITMKTDVSDPYWFVACRVYAKPIFDTNFGPISDTHSQYNYACAVFDPTCASTRYGGWETFTPSSATLEVLRSFGMNLSNVINGVRIQHTTTEMAASAKKTTSSRFKGAKLATKAQIEAKAKKFAAKH